MHILENRQLKAFVNDICYNKKIKKFPLLISMLIIMILVIIISFFAIFPSLGNSEAVHTGVSNDVLFDSTFKADINFVRFCGSVAILQLNSTRYVRINYMFHNKPRVTTKQVIQYGYYFGSHAPNSAIYLPATSYSIYNDDNYISVVAFVDDIPVSSVVTIKYTTKEINCMASRFKITSTVDTENSCVLLNGIAPLTGSIHYMISQDESELPDYYLIEKYGNFAGYFDHNQFSLPICNLDQNQVYIMNIMQFSKDCYSEILRFNITTHSFSEDFKWGKQSVAYQHLAFPSTKQTGVNYRHYGGIEYEPASFNNELISSNGIVNVNIPKDYYKTVTDTDDMANYGIKWRKAKHSKNDSVLLKFVLIGSGDIYISLLSKQKNDITPQEVVRDGYFIGYMTDELVLVKLSDVESTISYAYVAIKINDNKMIGPFSSQIK